MSIRPVKSKPTLEGAGVHLRRAFGFGDTSQFDPFLLLDDFRNDVPNDYLAGFPWHPHRGIETITYVLAGTVEPEIAWATADPVYLDVSIAPGQRKTLPVETTRHAFAYVFAGSGKFCNASGPLAVPTEGIAWLDTAPPSAADNRSLVVFDRGDEVDVQAGPDGIRFLLVSGKPLGEPVAWYGPIVMNTQEQLRQAFDELEEGTFLKR
jgi:redox-sensitive bicupin YhaK (pirin superfamily)